MAEYIERELLREAVKKYAVETKYDWTDAVDLEEFEKILDNMPIADVAPVRRGRWIWADDGYCRCSECTQKAPIVPQYQDEPITQATHYCPQCGARMDGGADNAVD